MRAIRMIKMTVAKGERRAAALPFYVDSFSAWISPA